MRELFSPDMKLSDMIDMNYSLMRVISRVEINLRHAGMKAADACAFCGMDVPTFMLICNVYSFPDRTWRQSTSRA